MSRTGPLVYYVSSCSDSVLWWPVAGVTVKVTLRVRMGRGHLSQEPLFPAYTSVSPSVKVGTWKNHLLHLLTSSSFLLCAKKSTVSDTCNIWIYSWGSFKHYRQPLQLGPTSTQPCPALSIFPTIALVTRLRDPFSVIFPCLNRKKNL